MKYGMRSERAGIFGKIRPGFMHFGENSLDITFSPPIQPQPNSRSISAEFSNYILRGRVAFRFDIGDTIIRFGGLCGFYLP